MERSWGKFESKLGVGPIHGDFNVGNVLVGPGSQVLVDFDQASTGPREWDLATIAPTRVLGWTADEWRAFSNGYAHDLLSSEHGVVLQELVHLRSLIWMLSSREFARRYERGRRLLDEWIGHPEKRCFELDWPEAFRAFPLPV